jgi:hypothetical protein
MTTATPAMVYTTALFSDAHVDIRSQSDDCEDVDAEKSGRVLPEGVVPGEDI